MADHGNQSKQSGENAGATSGGGASTERGGRDAGMPGPAPDAVEKESRRAADSTAEDDSGAKAGRSK